ncbi:MAG: TRAP transporter small permease [Firmicutes bacterium]|nr:TRAP transporter small permease [Bacillota bacterium]
MGSNRTSQAFDLIENAVASIVVVAMVVVLSLQVLSRYLFNAPLYWSEELARFIFIWSVFLGAAMAFRRGTHMSVDLITGSRLPGRVRAALVLFSKVVVTAFSLFLIQIGAKFAQRMLLISSPAIGVRLGVVYAILPLSAILSVLFVWAGTSRR